VPYSKLLLNGTVLASFAAGFGAYWGLSLLIGWFTPYLIKGLGYTQREASWITILPWAAGPFVAVFAGWFSQHLLARDVSTRIARGLFGGASVSLGGIALMAVRYVPSDTLKIALIVIGIVVPGVIYIMGHAIVSEITPVRQRGAMLAINNAWQPRPGSSALMSWAAWYRTRPDRPSGDSIGGFSSAARSRWSAG